MKTASKNAKHPDAAFSPSRSGNGLSVDPNPGFVSRSAPPAAYVPTNIPRYDGDSTDESAGKRGVLFLTASGQVDFAQDGEPFVLGSGQLLAVMDADGAVIRLGVGKLAKYGKIIDAALQAMAQGQV